MEKTPILRQLFYLSLAWVFASPGLEGKPEKPYHLLLADHTSRQLFLYSETQGIVWQKQANALFDAWVLKDGSIVYTTKQTAERIIPDIQAGEGGTTTWVYNYGTGFNEKDDKLPNGMIYTCEPLPDGGFLITESGTFRLVELNHQGELTKVIPIPETNMELRYALRLARRSPDGNYYVPYFGEGILKVLNSSGTLIDSIDVNNIAGLTSNSAYETFFLENGDLLISCGPQNQVVRLNTLNEVVWRLEASELAPDINLYWITSLFPRGNGNLIVCNYCKGEAQVKAFEITPDKKIVWTLENAGPAVKGLTRLQLLDQNFRPIADSNTP